MTRGAKKKKDGDRLKKVLKFTCLKLLSFQLYIVTRSLTTCTIQSLLVAMSPSGGNWLPPLVCASLLAATCVNRVTPVAGGGAAAPGSARPAVGRAAAAFFAAR